MQSLKSKRKNQTKCDAGFVFCVWVAMRALSFIQFHILQKRLNDGEVIAEYLGVMVVSRTLDYDAGQNDDDSSV